jgi:hypothetical protein
MGREPVEKTIDGEKYRFMLMKPTESLDIMTKLADVFGPSISKLFASFDKNNDKINVDTALLGESIAVLCSSMNEGRVSDIVKIFTRNVISLSSEGGKPGSGQITDVVFEDHFQGRLLHLAKVFLACLEVQYADFFVVFKGKIGFLKNLAAISLAKQTSKDGNGIHGGQ